MILVAPTAFKETHSAAQIAEAIALGARDVAHLGIRLAPVSDGGPGLIDAMLCAYGGAVHETTVRGPLQTPVLARVLLQGDTAFVESADACGIQLVPVAQRSPLHTSTYGVGELLLAAAAQSNQVVIGLGGSATIDCGLAAARALGCRMLNDRGDDIPADGRAVFELSCVEPTRRELPRITVLADVDNPLFGPNGAARIFGPQKGATPADVELLDAGLARVAEIIKRDLGIDVANLKGAGAAGGLAAGLHAFANATVVPGSAWVLDRLGMNDLLRNAHVLVTGEGAYDMQSTMGKVTGALVTRAAEYGIPVLLVTGRTQGPLPAHVTVATSNAPLSLADITELVRIYLPRLLSQ